jgi:hypothetical protein
MPVIRPLTSSEVYRAQGHREEVLRTVQDAYPRGGGWALAALAGGAPTARLAEAVLQRAAGRLAEANLGAPRSSVRGPGHPSAEDGGEPPPLMDDDSDSDDDGEFEAPRRPRSASGPSPRPAVSTRATGGERHAGRPTGAPGMAGVRAAVSALIAGSISSGTTSTYASQVQHWWRWRAARGLLPYLDGRDPVADQEDLVLFVAYVGVSMKYRHATVHVMLYAMRYHHIVARQPDPLVDTPLLKIVMKGLKRLQGGKGQKIPVTMGMLRALARGLDLDDWDDLVLLLGMSVMFVFLLRSGEALRKGSMPDADRCLRVGTLLLAESGEPVGGAPDGADEVMLFIPKSKADQGRVGFCANVFATPGDLLCPVGLLKRARAMNPRHFSRPDNYLLTLTNGKVLSRDQVVEALRGAAVAAGVPAGAVSVISLRAGGASAMWDVGFSVDEIKRRGRWASECWRIYTWEGRERARGVAARMLGSAVSVLASVARFARE